MERLLRAKDFQEALGIQVEHLQSQLTAAAEEATQIGPWIVGLANLPRRFLVKPTSAWLLSPRLDESD